MSTFTKCDYCGEKASMPRIQLRVIGENGDSDPLDFCNKSCLAKWAQEERKCDCSHGETCVECMWE